MRDELQPADLGAGALNRPDLVREAQAREADARAAQRDWRLVVRSRLTVALVAFGLWVAGIQGRLLYLQVLQYDSLLQRATRQWNRTHELPPKRGDLLDREGRVLAYSVDGHAIFAEPPLVAEPEHTAAQVCAAIQNCTPADREEMSERLRRDKSFQYLWRQASPRDAAHVLALKIRGIGVLREQRRYYPNRELGAHVLGYVGIDNIGRGGIESVYNSQISGRPGLVLLQTDGTVRAFDRIERPPTAGSTLELTINRDIQYIAERELEAGVAEFGARGGTVLVLAPRTGDVLALANWPTFNPNRFQDADAEHRRNRAVQEIYEPGSTFKVVTASGAFEEGLVKPEDPIDVSAGYIRFGSRQIDDLHRYGVLTFAQVLIKSSNVGAIKVGMRLGPERLSDYVRRFGFGQAIAKDLPGQSRGIVWDADKLTDSALASVSMGYQVGVTPIQMATAVNAIASGGDLIEPRVVRAVINDGRRAERPVRVIRRAVSEATANRLTGIMELVVEEGTAKAAKIDGYTIAGKTGTAAKLEGGRYSHSDYNASFVGFVPSRSPAVTILVVIDSPHGKGFYGGSVAAPIFKRIAQATLRYLGIPPNVDPSAKILVARREVPSDSTVVPTAVSVPQIAVAPAQSLTEGVMPDLRGMSAREAVHLMAQLGIATRLFGDGLVIGQQIAPGTPVEHGISCLVQLGRRLPALEEGPASR